ncbi:MAG: ABC transporter substrate-binding protein [Planctomycetaceae bacterium]
MKASQARRIGATLAVIAMVSVACGKSVSSSSSTPSGSSGPQLANTTTAGTQPVDKITWALYRETNSLDPIYAFDYPENTVLSVLCEQLLHQNPDGSITSGLADLSYPDPTTMVFTLKPGITFWDGNPLTPEDVVYSLERNTDPNLGGFYGATFSRVKSIEATGSDQVTITLKEPDYWLAGELASTPGWIVEKSYVEKEGKDFGTASGGTMCTGPYKFQSWKVGDKLVVVRNDNYWNPDVKPLVQEIDFVGAPSEAALTSSMISGDINGSFAFSISTLDQLKSSSSVTVTAGNGWNTDAFIISSFDGALGDVRVRQALSMALDRQGIIDTVYKGAALMPKSLSAPGTWGYGGDVFANAYAQLPDMTQNVAEAKKLVQEAGATGKTITIGMSSELANLASEASAYQSAAESIGLKVKLKSVSAANYINFFIDPSYWKSVDGFFTTNYGDYADPAALLSTLALTDGSQNYSYFTDPKTGYNNPQVQQLLLAARSEADPTKRAEDVAQAQAQIMKDLPWIPNAFPYNNVITSSNLTGATASFAYMFAPWANDLGGTG